MGTALRASSTIKVPVLLSEKEAHQIDLQREAKFAKYEVHIEGGQPVMMVQIREKIKL